MSEENISSKQPLIRYVNRQQMSWRAVDVERLIGEEGIVLFVPRVSCSAMKGATRKRKALRITATKQSGGIAEAVPASRSVVRKIRSKAARWFAAKKVRPCL